MRPSDYHLTGDQIHVLIYEGPRPGRHQLRDRARLKTLAYTGLRRHEAAALDARDVDLGARRIIVRAGKGGKSRAVPISAEPASDLAILLARRQTGPVFVSDVGRMPPLSIRQVSRIVAEAGLRSGVSSPYPRAEQLGCHILRHSFARRWHQAGGNVRALADILGHASTSTTLDLYGTPSEADVRADYDRIIGLTR